ncbi:MULTISPECIES: spore coat protein U domain-containing protein [Chitinibacter]|uniref:spore coat protein U domain-containing protein n=1 Tax=Chitinibacter TaxID=230666 RepID=UPI0004047334|nr:MULTISPECIES: spore coat protein U domain-containing protein [Chitinibacter]
MNKIATHLLAALAAATLATSAVAASKNVIINANIVGTCAFTDASDVTINMGDLRAGQGDVSQPASTQFWCSAGVPYTISADSGRNAENGSNQLISGANKLPYELALDKESGTGAGIASPETLNLSAKIKGSDLDAAAVANGYTDTVVLTLTP